MKEVAIIGVDLAKTVFQLHGAAADGSVVFRKKLTRVQFHKFTSGHPACLVAMEACGSAHCWAREMAQIGHDPWLIETFAPVMECSRCGRDFAAWLGLVPLQRSTGGKQILGKTSKMGQCDIRRLLIVGAMAVVVHRFEGALPRDHGWRKCWPARPACWSQSRLERQPNTSELIWT